MSHILTRIMIVGNRLSTTASKYPRVFSNNKTIAVSDIKFYLKVLLNESIWRPHPTRRSKVR